MSHLVYLSHNKNIYVLYTSQSIITKLAHFDIKLHIISSVNYHNIDICPHIF